MLRLVGVLIAVLWAIGAAILTWPGFFRVERMWPIAQIVSFRGLVVAAFGAIALIMLLLAVVRPLRRFALAMAAVGIIAAVAGTATIVGRGTGTESLPAKTESSIRVMTWNTAGEATAPETVAMVAVAMSADIVVLPETTIESGEQVAIEMRELGQPMWALYADYPDTEWDAGSTTLLITPDLGDYAVIPASEDGTSTVPSAIAMPTDGNGPIVVAAHAVAPRQSYMADWREDLQWLADQCGDANVIMAGDFNATVDHMSGLGVDGGMLGRCHDAAAETGNGSVGTWSTEVPALLGVPIDHVMVSDHWTPTGSIVLRSHDDAGSDHRPLIVQLEPAG